MHHSLIYKCRTQISLSFIPTLTHDGLAGCDLQGCIFYYETGLGPTYFLSDCPLLQTIQKIDDTQQIKGVVTCDLKSKQFNHTGGEFYFTIKPQTSTPKEGVQ